jgi:lipid-binding SYLF domain-containing protein
MRHHALPCHLSGYEQFILGDEIAMVAVFVEQARLCNVFDQVQHWTVGGDDCAAAAAAPVSISQSASN